MSGEAEAGAATPLAEICCLCSHSCSSLGMHFVMQHVKQGKGQHG